MRYPYLAVDANAEDMALEIASRLEPSAPANDQWLQVLGHWVSNESASWRISQSPSHMKTLYSLAEAGNKHSTLILANMPCSPRVCSELVDSHHYVSWILSCPADSLRPFTIAALRNLSAVLDVDARRSLIEKGAVDCVVKTLELACDKSNEDVWQHCGQPHLLVSCMAALRLLCRVLPGSRIDDALRGHPTLIHLILNCIMTEDAPEHIRLEGSRCIVEICGGDEVLENVLSCAEWTSVLRELVSSSHDILHREALLFLLRAWSTHRQQMLKCSKDWQSLLSRFENVAEALLPRLRDIQSHFDVDIERD